MSILFLNTTGLDDFLGRHWNTLSYFFIYPKKIKLHIEEKSVERKYDAGLLETKTHRVGIKTFQSVGIY